MKLNKTGRDSLDADFREEQKDFKSCSYLFIFLKKKRNLKQKNPKTHPQKKPPQT